MKLSPKAILLSVVAGASGVIVLLGYFFSILDGMRVILLDWAVILTAVVLLVGVANLARVHWDKLKTRQTGGVYSLVLLLSLLATLLVGFLGPTKPAARWVFDYVQIPIESSLMALLAVILAYAVARLFNRRLNAFSFIFIGTFLLVLIGTISFPGFELPLLRDLRDAVSQILASAGARGILLGVGLGTIATGLRVLIGADRPYGD